MIFLFLMLPMVFKVKEHNMELKNVQTEGTQEKYSVKDMINCVFTNKYIFIYFLAVIVSTIFCTVQLWRALSDSISTTTP